MSIHGEIRSDSNIHSACTVVEPDHDCLDQQSLRSVRTQIDPCNSGKQCFHADVGGSFGCQRNGRRKYTERFLLKNECSEIEALYGKECRKNFRYKLLLVGFSSLLMRISSVIVRWRVVVDDQEIGLGVNVHHVTGKILFVILSLQFTADMFLIALSSFTKSFLEQSLEFVLCSTLNTIFFLDCVAFVMNPVSLVPVFQVDRRVVIGEDAGGFGIILSVILINIYFNGVFRIRLWISFWFQTGNLLVFITSDVLYTWIYATPLALSQTVFAVIATTLGLLGVGLSERRDRILFIHYQESTKHLLYLVDRQHGASKLEDLISMLLSVKSLAESGRHKRGEVKRVQDMQKIAMLSQRCVSIVISGDLFSPNMATNAEMNDDVRRFILNQQAHHIAMNTHEQSPTGNANVQPYGDTLKHSRRRRGSVMNTAAHASRRPSGASQRLSVPLVIADEPAEPFEFPTVLSFVGVDAKRNVLPVEVELNNHLLSQMGFALLKRMGCLDKLECDDQTTITFLQRIENLYFPSNPYHNSTHAAAVAHQALTFFNSLDPHSHISRSSKELAKIALWTAALAHDVNHPGKSNAFLINSRHSLATVYNDIHVLESFHCAVTFQTLQGQKCNIFENLSNTDYEYVRKMIIDLILATDMKEHFDILARFRVAHANSTATTEVDLLLTMKVIIKAADIGHSVLKWEDHFDWSIRVVAEFYAQGDEEERRNMGKSPLCDRSKVAEIGNSQAGFLQFVVQPLYEELCAICDWSPMMQDLLRTVKSNVERWKHLDSETQQALEDRLELWQHLDENAGNRPGSGGSGRRPSLSIFPSIPRVNLDGHSPTAGGRRKSITLIPKSARRAPDSVVTTDDQNAAVS